MATQAGNVSGLAKRYADALYDLADEQKALDPVAGDLRTIAGLLAESEELRELVRSPLLGREAQGKAMEAVLARAGVSALTRNFVGVVARNRRLYALSDMIRGFLQTLAQRRGEVTAEVTAARPLTPEQVEQVTEALRRVVAGKVAVDVKVDPSLLGGLVVQVGSRLFDSSIKTKLLRMQHAMKGVQ